MKTYYLILRDDPEILARLSPSDMQAVVQRYVKWREDNSKFVTGGEKLVYVGGAPAEVPRYRVQVSVPEGQFDDERRSNMVAAVTKAILDAENGKHKRDPNRVWVFASEVPDGTWGGGGRIARLADVANLMIGDAEKARAYAQKRIKASREARAV